MCGHARAHGGLEERMLRVHRLPRLLLLLVLLVQVQVLEQV